MAIESFLYQSCIFSTECNILPKYPLIWGSVDHWPIWVEYAHHYVKRWCGYSINISTKRASHRRTNRWIAGTMWNTIPKHWISGIKPVCCLRNIHGSQTVFLCHFSMLLVLEAGSIEANTFNVVEVWTQMFSWLNVTSCIFVWLVGLCLHLLSTVSGNTSCWTLSSWLQQHSRCLQNKIINSRYVPRHAHWSITTHSMNDSCRQGSERHS